jgi:hypothetical protein
MRTWLYNRITAIDALDAEYKAAGKVIASGAADSPQAPFLVAAMNVEQPFLGMPPSMRANQIPFTIWVHDTPGSMLRIDAACIALKNNIPTQDAFMVGSMSVFEIRWSETGEDAYDDHFKTNCRPVRFSMVTRR